MIFELNFSTKTDSTGIRICYFFQRDLDNFKECCPICVTDVCADNEKGLLYVTIDDKVAKSGGYNDPYTLGNRFRKLITEQESKGYIAWVKVHLKEFEDGVMNHIKEEK